MNNIFQTLVYQREKKKDTVLATIIWDDGSAPRGKGSQIFDRDFTDKFTPLSLMDHPA